MSQIPARCVDGAKALSESEIAAMAQELHGDWRVDGRDRIERRLKVQDFEAALKLVNGIGAVAEAENHHPDLAISDYRFVTVTLSTHDAAGLTGNDFVVARQADALAG